MIEIHKTRRLAEHANGADFLVPLFPGYALRYRNARQFLDRMSNEERYEANIRSDFRVRPTRVSMVHDGAEVVRV